LVLEGHDDARLFVRRSVGSESLIACGKKKILLQAHQQLGPGESMRIIFVTDCDYDVATGRLRPASNLIVTRLVDVEADLIQLGALESLVIEFVPGVIMAPDTRALVTTEIVQRAGTIAEGLGRFRLVSAQQHLGLTFDRIKLRRYREQNSGAIDLRKLANSLIAASDDCPLTPDELLSATAAAPGGIKVRHGKDWLRAIAVVLHQDFGVPTARLAELESMLRMAFTDDGFGRWEVTDRIRRWELASGCRVLLQ
jgi:hypothetical protein